MFRIWIYLDIKYFFKALFSSANLSNRKKFINKYISTQSKKKYSALFSQCRVAFYFILKFLMRKSNRNEIIFCAYNLPEMVNIAENLKLKVKFYDLSKETGSLNINQIKKNISKKTLAVVLTNMFNNYKDAKKIKTLTAKYKVHLIEDNAIYFDNFSKIKKKLFYSGSFGDFSIYSFNIMKNISSFYGGAATTNDQNFLKFYNQEEKKLKNFFTLPLIKQTFIYFVLKIMSVDFLYKIFFIYLIRFAHKYQFNIFLRLFYPSLKSIKKRFPKYYYSKISNTAIHATYFQLKDNSQRKKLFNIRKEKHLYFLKRFQKIKTKKISLINIKDINYQNFLDFPILVKEKDKFNRFLLGKGIEVRLKHYYNCEKMMHYKKSCKIAERYEKELICFPIHKKIKYSYIDYIAKNTEEFFAKHAD